MRTNIIILVVFIMIATIAQAHYGEKDKAYYKFGYGVDDPHTHDCKHHIEMREGNHVIGEYSVKEPDGSYRTVKYKAGPHSGFEAVLEEIRKSAHFGKKRETVNDIGVFRWDNDDSHDHDHVDKSRSGN